MRLKIDQQADYLYLSLSEAPASRSEEVLPGNHLGFEVLYIFKGVVHKYRPDFLIRRKTGDYLVLETKGQDTDQDKTKRAFLDEWVKAVNEHGGFGKWAWTVSRQPREVIDILEEISR